MSCKFCGRKEMALAYVSGPGAEIVEEECWDRVQVGWIDRERGIGRYENPGCGAIVRINTKTGSVKWRSQ